MCISAVTWIATGAVSTSTGGIAAVVVSRLRGMKREVNDIHKKESRGDVEGGEYQEREETINNTERRQER
jgi:hypothetical protein